MSSDEANEEVVSENACDDDEEEGSEAVLSLFTESTESEADVKQVLRDEDILQPSVAVDDNDDVDDDDDDDEYDDGDGIPWHHMQLYQLYGDEADYFLHPKLIRSDKKVRVKPSALLKSRCGDCSLDNMGRSFILFYFFLSLYFILFPPLYLSL